MTSHTGTRSHKQANKATSQYKADDGPLSAAQLRQIKKHAQQCEKHALLSNLFEKPRAQGK